MFELVEVPIWLLVAGYATAFSVVSTTLTLFFRGGLLSRKNHEEIRASDKEAKEELRSTVQSQSETIRQLQARSVVFPSAATAEAVTAQRFLAGGGA